MTKFADSKLNVPQHIEFVFHRLENIVGKEENACYQQFLRFTQFFSKPCLLGASKVVLELEMVSEFRLICWRV